MKFCVSDLFNKTTICLEFLNPSAIPIEAQVLPTPNP